MLNKRSKKINFRINVLNVLISCSTYNIQDIRTFRTSFWQINYMYWVNYQDIRTFSTLF